jgi:hypothetical protein
MGYTQTVAAGQERWPTAGMSLSRKQSRLPLELGKLNRPEYWTMWSLLGFLASFDESNNLLVKRGEPEITMAKTDDIHCEHLLMVMSQ